MSGNKYDIPILIDPRTQYKQYYKPVKVILYENKDKTTYTVQNLLDEKDTLSKKVTSLETSVTSLQNEITSLKSTILKLCDIVASINLTTAQTQVDSATIVKQLDQIKNS